MNYSPLFADQPSLPVTDEQNAPSRRIFIFEAGWQVGIKTDSTREFCYMMASGQDYYHRLLDGEVFLARGGEKLCFSCALRRGLILFEPRQLRDSVVSVPANDRAMPLELDWRDANAAAP